MAPSRPPSPDPRRPALLKALRAGDYARAETLLAQGVPLTERPNRAIPDVVAWNDALRKPGSDHLDWLWAHGLRPSRPAIAFEALRQALLANRLDLAQWWVDHEAPLTYPGPLRPSSQPDLRKSELIDSLAEAGGPAAIAWLGRQGAPLFSRGRSASAPVWIALYQQPADRVISVVEALVRASPQTLFGHEPYGERDTPHGVLVELATRISDRFPPPLLAQLWVLLAHACEAAGRTVDPHHRAAIEATAVCSPLEAIELASARQTALSQRPASSPRPRRRT